MHRVKADDGDFDACITVEEMWYAHRKLRTLLVHSVRISNDGRKPVVITLKPKTKLEGLFLLRSFQKHVRLQ